MDTLSRRLPRVFAGAGMLLAAIGLGGCAGFSPGKPEVVMPLQVAPPSPVATGADPAAVDAYALANLVSADYGAKQRNAIIEYNLITLNNQYYAFEYDLQRSKTGQSSGSAIAALLFNLASTLTDSAGVKANYVAANSLVVGTNEIVNKEQFLEQSVNTLIAAMRGNRAEVYKRIRIGMTQPVGLYTLSDAHNDLLEYQRAGTLTQGMAFATQATKQASDEKKAAADKAIREALIYTPAQMNIATCVSDSLDVLTVANTEALRRAIQRLPPVPSTGDLAALQNALTRARYDGKPAYQRQVYDALKQEQLLLPKCEGL